MSLGIVGKLGLRPGQRVLVRLPEAAPTDHRVTGVVCWPGQEDGTWEVWCRDGGVSWVEMEIPAANLDIDPLPETPPVELPMKLKAKDIRSEIEERAMVLLRAELVKATRGLVAQKDVAAGLWGEDAIETAARDMIVEVGRRLGGH
jgi:hypothetical protein